MAFESLGCHDISRRRWSGYAGRRTAASACRSGLAGSLWWLTASSGCTAREWGSTGRGSGVLGVGGAFVQYAHPLASRSRSSWRRLTRADSRQSRSRTLTTGPQRRWREGVGGGGPVTEAPGSAARTPDSLLRCPVSTALTSTSPASARPEGIVGILRFLSGVQSRFGVNVSAVDTDTPSGLAPRPLASRTTSLPKVPARASVLEVMAPTCLRSEETAQCPEPSTARHKVRLRAPVSASQRCRALSRRPLAHHRTAPQPRAHQV